MLSSVRADADERAAPRRFADDEKKSILAQLPDPARRPSAPPSVTNHLASLFHRCCRFEADVGACVRTLQLDDWVPRDVHRSFENRWHRWRGGMEPFYEYIHQVLVLGHGLDGKPVDRAVTSSREASSVVDLAPSTPAFELAMPSMDTATEGEGSDLSEFSLGFQ